MYERPLRTPDLLAYPEPWDHNPSQWSQRVPIAILATPAFLIAVYMGLYQWGLIDSVWDPFFGDGSERVLTSDVAKTMDRWVRIPDSIFGSLAYLGDIIFSLAGSTRRWQYRPWLVLIFGIDVIPLGIVSAVLVVLQGTVVGYWCTLCLFTAVISLVLIIFAYDEVWSTLLYLWRIWKRKDSFKTFWDIFWGKPHPLADEVGEEFVRERTEARSGRKASKEAPAS